MQKAAGHHLKIAATHMAEKLLEDESSHTPQHCAKPAYCRDKPAHDLRHPTLRSTRLPQLQFCRRLTCCWSPALDSAGGDLAAVCLPATQKDKRSERATASAVTLVLATLAAAAGRPAGIAARWRLPSRGSRQVTLILVLKSILALNGACRTSFVSPPENFNGRHSWLMSTPLI